MPSPDSRPTPRVFPAVRPPRMRRGGWIQTVTGRQFWPLDPEASEVHLEDIAGALSKLCRWGGHVPGDGIFSVAQHCVLVAHNLPHRFRAQGLMHDAHEAYIVDIPRPIKRYLVNYDVMAARLDACIGDRFGLELCDLPPEVDEADSQSLATERRDLLLPTPTTVVEDRHLGIAPWKMKIVPWCPAEARAAFLGMAHALGIR